MYPNRQTQQAQVAYSTTDLKDKKSTLSRQLFSQRISCVCLGLIVCIVSVLTLLNLRWPSHVLTTSSERRLSPTQGQVAQTSSRLQVSPTKEHVVHEVGALWVSPLKGQVVHDSVRLEAYIHPGVSDIFNVDHIIFTAWWPGVDLNNWRDICTVSRPTRHTIYSCDGNLRMLQAPVGTITVSFDMYDTHGHVKLAPNGGFAVTYSPLSISR